MKIAIISTFLGQKISGAEISSFLLAKNLSKKEKVFAITAKITKELPFKTYSLGLAVPNMVLMIGTPFTNWIMYKKIMKILQKEQPNIVHIQDFSVLDAAVRSAERLGIPTVMTVRDYRFHCNLAIDLEQNKIERNYNWLVYLKWLYISLRQRKMGLLTPLFFPVFFYANHLNRKNIKKIDFIVSVSDFVKHQLTKSGISKIKTIKVPKPDWTFKKFIKKDYVRLFAAGVLAKPKGFHVLIETMKKVAAKNKNIKLFIAGEGSMKKELIDMVKNEGLREQVHFLGRISYKEMEKQYAEADVVVVPSLWPEPLSRVIFEAFSIGRPVIATNVGGSSELVKDGRTGWLVKPFDVNELASKILHLDKKKIEKMGKEANKLINSEAHPSKVVEKHRRVYAGLK